MIQATEVRCGIVEAPVTVKGMRSYYNAVSKIYFLMAVLEKKARMRGLQLAEIRRHDKVLEVAVGIGHTFLDILKRVAAENIVCGLDLSLKMVQKTRTRASRNGYSNFDLREGDARCLPYPDDTFDALYNSYMLDLIPLADFPVVLREFHRVLKKEGRLVLVNLSKKDTSPVFAEKLYRLSPFLWGGCRPVLMEPFVEQAGFRNVSREMPKTLLPSEIVTALK